MLRNNSPPAKAGYYLTPRAPASQEESSDSQRKHSLQLVTDEELTDKCFENGSSLSIVLCFSHAQVPQSNSPSVTVKDQIWTTLEASLFSTLYGNYPGEMWDQKESAHHLPVYFLKQDCTRHSAENPWAYLIGDSSMTSNFLCLPFLPSFLSFTMLVAHVSYTEHCARQ